MVVFVIVGKSDPLYEVELGSSGKEDLAYLSQFILHSSLDMVDNAMWSNSSTCVLFSLNYVLAEIRSSYCICWCIFYWRSFLKVVDRFNSLVVSAYVTPGWKGIRLSHTEQLSDNIKCYYLSIRRVVSTPAAWGAQRGRRQRVLHRHARAVREVHAKPVRCLWRTHILTALWRSRACSGEKILFNLMFWNLGENNV